MSLQKNARCLEYPPTRSTLVGGAFVERYLRPMPALAFAVETSFKRRVKPVL